MPSSGNDHSNNVKKKFINNKMQLGIINLIDCLRRIIHRLQITKVYHNGSLKLLFIETLPITNQRHFTKISIDYIPNQHDQK